MYQSVQLNSLTVHREFKLLIFVLISRLFICCSFKYFNGVLLIRTKLEVIHAVVTRTSSEQVCLQLVFFLLHHFWCYKFGLETKLVNIAAALWWMPCVDSIISLGFASCICGDLIYIGIQVAATSDYILWYQCSISCSFVPRLAFCTNTLKGVVNDAFPL